jgi:hypothetical protein
VIELLLELTSRRFLAWALEWKIEPRHVGAAHENQHEECQ